MARRFSAPYQSEPVSSLASWARNLAVFSVIAVLVSIFIVRFGFLEIKPALATFFGALAIAGLSILVGLAAFVAIWQNGSRGMGRILLAFLIDAVVLAYPAYLGLQYRQLPPIHDITTDPIDPPRFEALARLRTGEGANTAVYAGLYSAEQQRLNYPDIEPVELEVPALRAYEVTLALINKRKWRIVDERPPQPRREGRIEAIAQTLIMGFREDVTIRIKPDGEGSRVDIRSSSRYFESDLGSNAARVTKLIDDINNAVDNAKPVAEEAAAAAQGAGEDGEEVTARAVRPRPSAIDVPPITGSPSVATTPRADQILQMRQHGIAGRARQPRVDADIDRAHEGRNVGLALGEAVQDRGFAGLAMADQEPDIALRVRNFRAVAGKIQVFVPPVEPIERGHVVDHRSVRRRHDRGRPAHHVIADETDLSLAPGERQMIGGVARRRHRFQRPARAFDDIAIPYLDIGPEIAVGAGLRRHLLALIARP